MKRRRAGASPGDRKSRPDSARGNDEEDSRSFSDVLAEHDSGDQVRVLRGREKRVASGAPAPAARQESRTIWSFPVKGQPLLGVASGIQASQLRRLRAGKIHPEVEIDLHGLRADAARRHLLDELHAAIESKRRCALIVHGKGLRSAGDPVLRSSLPEWLADPQLGGSVLAFAPAKPADGGSGATYVLLRRS